MDNLLYNALCDSCRKFLFVFMYPEWEINFPLGSLQHRDLVRTYFGGAVDGLMKSFTLNKIQVEDRRQLLDSIKAMTAVEWMPGREFYPDGYEEVPNRG